MLEIGIPIQALSVGFDWLSILIIGIILFAIGYVLHRHVAEAAIKTIGYVLYIIGIILIVVGIVLLVVTAI